MSGFRNFVTSKDFLCKKLKRKVDFFSQHLEFKVHNSNFSFHNCKFIFQNC